MWVLCLLLHFNHVYIHSVSFLTRISSREFGFFVFFTTTYNIISNFNKSNWHRDNLLKIAAYLNKMVNISHLCINNHIKAMQYLVALIFPPRFTSYGVLVIMLQAALFLSRTLNKCFAYNISFSRTVRMCF